MSDGNFNRALLPSTPYRSGVKMGYQQAKAQAARALEEVLRAHCPTLSDDERQALLDAFKKSF